MSLKIIILILLLSFTTVFAQIEMHGTDRASESLAPTKKDRLKAIQQEFARENKLTKALKKSKADRAEIARTCPLPSGWVPNKANVAIAKEWMIVPSWNKSKSYPRRFDIDTPNEMEEFETKGDPKIDSCDYVTIKFKGDRVTTVDFTKCQEPEITMDSYRPCHNLLKSLAEKSKTK